VNCPCRSSGFRACDASASEQRNWRLIGHGEGIHWPEIDEDISVEGLLAWCGAKRHAA